jgi:excisionase family DNA binding protein
MTAVAESLDQLPQLAFNVAEAAVILGVKPWVVRRLIQNGKLRARQTGARYIIPKSAILEYLAGSDEPIVSAS